MRIQIEQKLLFGEIADVVVAHPEHVGQGLSFDSGQHSLLIVARDDVQRDFNVGIELIEALNKGVHGRPFAGVVHDAYLEAGGRVLGQIDVHLYGGGVEVVVLF